jgi:hypothetical protein
VSDNTKERIKMNIPETLLKKWKALRSPGDAAKMAEKSDSEFSDETFNRAFREEKCNDEVFKIMADFYEEKLELIKEYL